MPCVPIMFPGTLRENRKNETFLYNHSSFYNKLTLSGFFYFFFWQKKHFIFVSYNQRAWFQPKFL